MTATGSSTRRPPASIDGNQLVLESAALDDAQLRDALDAGADVVLTDSNRRRSQT